METKHLAILMLLILIAAPAMAATITTTWNTPTTGKTYSNNFANRPTLDLNVGFTDNNSEAGSDKNITLKVIRKSDWSTVYSLKTDANVFYANANKTSAWACATGTAVAANGTCSYNWIMPLNTEMAQEDYCIDANVVRYYHSVTTGETVNQGDKNAMTCFTVYNGFAQANAIRGFLSLFGIALGAGILIGGIVAITTFGTDPTKTLATMVVGGIALAIMLVLVGTFAGMM